MWHDAEEAQLTWLHDICNWVRDVLDTNELTFEERLVDAWLLLGLLELGGLEISKWSLDCVFIW